MRNVANRLPAIIEATHAEDGRLFPRTRLRFRIRIRIRPGSGSRSGSAPAPDSAPGGLPASGYPAKSTSFTSCSVASLF